MSRSRQAYYLFIPADRVLGPHNFEILREWRELGAITPDTQVCVVGSEAWVSFREIKRSGTTTAYIQHRIEERRRFVRPESWSIPITPRQRAKLAYFDVPLQWDNLSKAQAAELIECFVQMDPAKERAYQCQPPDAQQCRELRELGISSEGLSHQEAKYQILNRRMEKRVRDERAFIKSVVHY